MSLFGKVLALLNVFAVFGVVALIATDYAKRRSWQYAVFRQDLMMNGLPLDKEERDGQGRLLFENIGEKTQKELFPIAPVTTQQEEVERVQSQLRGKIDAAGDKRKQMALYARVLMPLALTNEQREQMIAYQTYLRDDKTAQRLKTLFIQADKAARQPPPKDKPRAKPYEEAFHDALTAQHAEPTGPLAEAFLAVMKAEPRTPVDKALDQSLDNQLAQLKTQFDQLFKDALDRTQTVDAKGPSERPVPQRKRIIANLLFNLVDALPDEGAAPPKLDLVDNPGYRRFLNVVGVRYAAIAANDEAKVLDEIAAEARLERLRDRGTFAVEHRKIVDQIQAKAVEAETHALLLASKEKEARTHEDDLKTRRKDVEYYQKQLDAARIDTAARLKELRGMSDALLQERVKLRDATTKNQELEKQIRVLEEGR